MPFTPFHMGPGAAIKAVAGRHFSLTIFGFAQVATDLETLVRLLRHDSVVHGYTHTYLGALIIGVFSVFAGKSICQRLLVGWNMFFDFKYLKWMQVDSGITWTAAFTGAFLGTFSHVFLDSVMHADMSPFWPISSSNGMLDLVPAAWIHLLCIALGVFGLMTLLVFGLWNKWAIEIN